MLWVKAFHIIFVICWFAGLFYLPRLFVYHADANDEISNARFKIMERKLYYAIMTPCAIGTIAFGVWLMSFNPAFYMQALWFHLKLACVFLLLIFHLSCGYYLKLFAKDQNKHTNKFYRYFNEIPSVLLLFIVILVVVKPF